MQPSTEPPTQQADPARVAVFNFGIQLVWGALLAVSLPARSIELTRGAHHDIEGFAILATIGACIAAIVQLIIGRISDARLPHEGHRRAFYLIGTLASFPLLLWFYTATTITQLAGAFFGLQIMLNIAGGPYQAAIPDHVPLSKAGITSSWMSIFQSLGSALGLIIAGFIQVQWLIGLLLIVGLGGSFLPTYLHLRRLPLLPASSESVTTSRIWITLLFSRAWIFGGFYILLNFLLFFVRESLGIRMLAAQRTDTALIFLCFTLTAIIGASLAARPSQTLDKRLVISIAMSIVCSALCALAFTHSLAPAFLLAAIAGTAWGAFVTADWALACALLPRAGMATAMGIWNMATVIPQILAPLLIAPLVMYFDGQKHGLGPRTSLLAAALVMLVGTLSIWGVPAQVQIEQDDSAIRYTH